MNMVCVAGFEPAAPRIQSENSDRTELHTENLKRFVLGATDGGSCGIRTQNIRILSPTRLTDCSRGTLKVVRVERLELSRSKNMGF